MVVRIKKVRGGFQVRSKGRITAKRTTLTKARRQKRLLQSFDA